MSKKIIKKNEEKQGLKIGFIGQGFVGKNHADDFERRGYPVVRYSLEKQFIKNRIKIRNCDIVFIAVPTPTTPKGFNDSIVRGAMTLVGRGKIAAIKSTIIPGTTRKIQADYPDRVVMHVPEFLSEGSAARDAAFPDRNIIGITQMSNGHKKAAKEVLSILPNSAYNKICTAEEAELIKYARNTLGYVRVVYMNILYDLARVIEADWSVIEESMMADPVNGRTYLHPVHKTGRGAGGHCFIKDFAALRKFYEKNINNKYGKEVLKSLEKKNIELLLRSDKDTDLVRGVYGEIKNPENIEKNIDEKFLTIDQIFGQKEVI